MTDHLGHGLPDLRIATVPVRFEELLRRELPLEDDEVDRLRRFEPRLRQLCIELAAFDLPETIQHDDLHVADLFARGARLRILDWGDASISHPFTSLLVTFTSLREVNGLLPGDPWFERLRDATWSRGERPSRRLRPRASRRRVRPRDRPPAPAGLPARTCTAGVRYRVLDAAAARRRADRRLNGYV